MPRMRRPLKPAAPIDRPSRIHIFVRQKRHLVLPALYGLALLGLAGFGLHVALAMRTEASFAPMRAEIGRAAGLHVTDIIVEGRNMTSETQLMTALGVSRGDPLLGFSVEAARRRIDQLSFVEHSTIERRLPGTILVQLTERRPFAVWQNQGRFVLIDRDGQVVAGSGSRSGGRNGAGTGSAGMSAPGMSAKDAEAFARLPLVVGAGAAGAATALIDALESEPTVLKQVSASVRVGQRRWNLILRSGVDVLLPEGAEPQALHRLAQLEDNMHLLERPLINIDMRLPDRMVVRPRPPAPVAVSPVADPNSRPGDAAGVDRIPAPASGRPTAWQGPA